LILSVCTPETDKSYLTYSLELMLPSYRNKQGALASFVWLHFSAS